MMKELWIVVIDRPCYPSVKYFDSKEKAEASLKEAVAEQGGGELYTVPFTLAKVVVQQEIMTDY
jgi:hypothetical protein